LEAILKTLQFNISEEK